MVVLTLQGRHLGAMDGSWGMSCTVCPGVCAGGLWDPTATLKAGRPSCGCHHYKGAMAGPHLTLPNFLQARCPAANDLGTPGVIDIQAPVRETCSCWTARPQLTPMCHHGLDACTEHPLYQNETHPIWCCHVSALEASGEFYAEVRTHSQSNLAGRHRDGLGVEEGLLGTVWGPGLLLQKA